MSQSVRPRDLARKEFQSAAAAVIDLQAQAIQELAKDLKATREFLADQATRIDALGQRIDDAHAALADRVGALEQKYQTRGLFVRLRWLLTEK
jgi:predicted trehalose synthase